jgi:hypothetical protein
MKIQSIHPPRTYPVAPVAPTAVPVAPSDRIAGFRAEIANTFSFVGTMGGSWGKPKPPKH